MFLRLFNVRKGRTIDRSPNRNPLDYGPLDPDFESLGMGAITDLIITPGIVAHMGNMDGPLGADALAGPDYARGNFLERTNEGK